MIRLTDVYKVYNQGLVNQVVAAREVNLHVEAGEMVCLRGPSGSGKTTILSIIGCVFPPTSGRATLAGTRISRLPDHFLARYRRTLAGCIFQDFRLLNRLSVLENVTLPLYPEGVGPSARRRQGMQLLERFGLTNRSDFPVASLSGGEMQRTAICRALIMDPPLILADEPTAHLDSALALDFLQQMAALKAGGKTIVLTSHDPRVYTHDAVDHVYDVKDGRLYPGQREG